MRTIFTTFQKNLAPTLLKLFAAILVVTLVMAQLPVPPAYAQAPQLLLTKTIEDGATTAQVGDIIRYRIRFECSSLTTACGEMEITDVLAPGLIYQGPPASSVPAGFTISYDSPSRTVTITKDDDNLLDGSQYDAVIAVQVDYDLRPLPTTINNTVNGRIDPPGPTSWINATPSSAPPITIGEANPYWAITKTLSSPIIEPTVDTDVTYQIAVCPTTPPAGQGNVPLRDIVLTDTIPAGATFVSASNGGTFSAGVVTWPTFAGPLYPPNCLTRFVTIRFDSPPFNVNDTVTNTVDLDADYTPSSGTCTSPCFGTTGGITHNIDPIAEVPTYSKDDTGDPVGFDGTGRFILSLNTNQTNFPSDDLILVDNLPAQLQVTSVTSGGWAQAFEHVRAHVEYSTNNGSTYTTFPGSPALYNTGATYTAPAANITNVRWRFEYDPDGTAPFSFTQAGLPYTWSFTTAPEIRVTPRATPTTADPPSGAPLPAAVAGNTYTNCVQVSRTNSSGNPVTDACDNENMTVQGDFVSLRVSKGETPGEAWDDLSDPNINTFVADGSILPGDTLRYTLTVEITERSSEALFNPTIQDTLPPASDFVFVRNGTATLDGGPVTQPTFTQVGQVLTWAWNSPTPTLTVNPLPLGSRFLTVEFFGYVPRGQTPGTYTNDLYVVTDSTDVVCEIGTLVQDSANGDVDGDADATDPACENPDDYVVERSAALRGEKWIRSTSADNSQVVLESTFLPDASCPNGGTTGMTGGGANPFTRFPCISQAFPEGALSPGQFAPPPTDTTIDDFEYNLRIFNDGNVNMLNYVLYDILPFTGDTGSGGTLSGTARNSEFRPTLRGPIEFISGPGLTSADFTIEYNNTTNPCRPEVFNQPTGDPVPGGCNNTWSGTWSTAARSFRIRLDAGSEIQPASTSSEVRFGVPMYIPFDAPPAGFDADDALSREIAWNSYSHVGSYDSDPGAGVTIQDLLASEPRKVGITVPERMSVGNRVWRDADNSGTINAPDDVNPGISGVTVNLYRDANNDGIVDGAAIETTTTDTEGYYLFSNIPYDSAVMNNNRYIIGIPAANFGVGQALESLRSSTGTPSTATYTTPTSNTIDSADDGIDPATPGLEVFSWSFTLEPGTEPNAETDLSNNDRDGPDGARRGVNAERDNNSDLTLDFGFFGGSDIPFSIGNHIWKDNGQTAAPGVFNYAERNDGIRQTDEPPVVGATVNLYRDGDADGIPQADELIRFDVTDANGFYLFDNLDPGPYFVEIPASNFATGQPLTGWYSSQPTGTETLGVNGGTTTADIDNDDNGINTDFPETNGVFSGVVVLIRGVNEPTGETYLSGEPDPGPATNGNFNPTGWDGPLSRGRFGETDETSNLTIDFGFIPPMSLGNRVWIDEGAGTTPFRAGYNNGLMDGTEVGVSGVRVELWRDTNGTPGLQIATDTFIRFTTTDATGYYLFDRLQPGSNYFVRIPTVNFAVGQPLRNYLSSTGNDIDNADDTDDNGVDNAAPATNGINSTVIAMSYNAEPLTPGDETDISPSAAYGPNNVGNYGQEDGDSNLTIDFGFVRPPRSIGNRLWIDANNNGVINGGETPVPTGVRVSLYQDSNNNGQPDDINTLGDLTDDWLAFDLTNANGYYLFDGLPPGRYVVGVDYINFAVAGLLEGYASSSGMPRSATYINPPITNPDSADHGIDRLQMGNPALSPYGILSASINLTATPAGAPTGETGSGEIDPGPPTNDDFNPTGWDGPVGAPGSRGRFGETDGNSNLTIDFGFFIPMSLGNRVWIDDGAGGGTFNNGIMDGGELPVANVRVDLYQDANLDGVPDGASLGFDTTDAGGYYLFDDLPEGSYVVVVAASNFTGVGPLVGYGSSIPTGTETVGVNGGTATADIDRDDNGVNTGAQATTGVRSGTITLSHTPLPSEPTGETELSGQADPGSATNMNFNPTGWDGPLSRGRWGESDDNSNLTIDFGFIPVFALGNRVWFDTNNDSLISAGEVGVDGVEVRLFASDGTTEILVGPDGILGTPDDAPGGVVTAGGGYYRFNNLPAGDYIVTLPAVNFTGGGTLVSYWSSGTTLDGTTGAIIEAPAPDPDTTEVDSDDNGTLSGGAVVASVVTLGTTTTSEPLGETDLSGGQGQPDGQANMTVDFGFYRVELGNLLYLDNNATPNGNYDGAPDTPIASERVRLFAAGILTEIPVGPDGILGTVDDGPNGMLTDGAGLYTFSGLPQGDYVVRASNSTVIASTIDTFNAADNADPDTNADNNDNGIGLGGAPVSSGTVTLTPGSTGALGNSIVTNGNGTTRNPTVDFGFVGLVAIGNRVWFDTGAGGGISNNGILDGAEVGVPNVTVELYTGAGVLVSSAITDSSGYYEFDSLYPGDYYIMIPAAEFQALGDLETYYSSVGNGTDETLDEDVDENGIDDPAPATNGIRSITYTLTPGGEVMGEDQFSYTGILNDNSVNFTADFGFTQIYSLGNRVWFDTDNSSTINGAEVGIDGITVNLYAAGDLTTILATDVTANGGYYIFDDLYPGDYVVSVAASNFTGPLNGYWSSGTSRLSTGVVTEAVAPDPDTTEVDSDDNGTLQTGGTLIGAVVSSAVTLGPSGNTEPTGETDLETGIGQGNQADGRANMTVDFGFYTMTLGNLVWSDTDKNGAFNGGEVGIDGLSVELWSQDGTTQLATTTTAGGGLYSFPDLPQGDYTVRVIAPVGTVSSVDTFDPTDTTNPTTNSDNNDNGVGTGGGTVVSNAVTLTPGAAQVSNTVDNATGSTTNPSMDFGFTPVFSLGNRVWFDTNNSSTIDGAEVGVDGVTVNLYAAGDLTTILATQVTANGGYYLFNGLQAGDYVVAIPSAEFGAGQTLEGYWSSATSRAANGSMTETAAPDPDDAPETDSDDNGTLQTSGALNGAVTSSVVTLGPALTAEPSGETDLDGTLPDNQQGQPDTQANMTVDFGFYTITLGNLVWNDLDNSGLLDGAEVGYDGVTVELRSGDSSVSLGTTTTSGGGFYTFSGLPTGDYIVRLPAVNFNPGGGLRDYRSSTGPLPAVPYEPAPDADTDTTDSDDNGTETNGLLGLGGYIQSDPVTLTPVAEESFNDAIGTTLESRVDFGVNNSPQIDLTVTKTDGQGFYLAGGTLTYTIVVTNNGPADANGMTVSDTRPIQITSWTWTCDPGTPAAYNCTDAPSSAADFTDTLDLPQLASVTYTVVAQVDPAATGTLTNSVTVTPPPTMTDMTPPDNTADDVDEPAALTVEKDDGVQIVAPGATLTYAVIVTNTGDANLTGIQLTDTLPNGVTFVSATGGGVFASGQVTWPPFNLASGASIQYDVTVQVADAATLAAGNITSLTNAVHVEDDGSNTGGDPVEDDDDDVDQIANSNIKTLIGSNQAGSANPNVLIGEILTYAIRIDLPNGTINNLQAVDVLEHGLAFVGCHPTIPISRGSLVLTQDPCATPTPPALVVQNMPTTDTDPASEDAGRHVTFNFGQVQNTSGSIQSLIVTYQVVVLDIEDNVDGVSGLNNEVTWSWEGGTLTGSAPGVDIVEPDLSIEKTVQPLVAPLGSTLSFKIHIEHTDISTAPAYDVLVTDKLPIKLKLDPASVRVRGTSGLPAPRITTSETAFTVFWSSFPMGDSADITFNAIFVGPSPAVNSASVAWVSIPIDPNPIEQPQSPYNRYSTERRYDPADPTNNTYRRESSVTITTPRLPETGFAPGVHTVLPAQPLDKTYQSMGNMWLEIPALSLKMSIAGIPTTANGWDLTWLANQAGYLEGTTYPGRVGTTGITGHVYLADGTPGPFVRLGELAYGNQVILHANGQRYIYEVRTNRVVLPNDLSVFKNDGYTWMTLITCKEYIPSLNKYDYRVAVRAVLVRVEDAP